MADGNGVALANGDDAGVQLWTPKHPYEPPGQVCTDITGRVGVCGESDFAKYDTCSLPGVYARAMFKGSSAGAGQPLVFTATGATPLLLFTSGAGGDGSPAGLPTTIQNGGKLSRADTSNKQAMAGNGASIAPDNDLVYRMFGFSMGIQGSYVVANSRKSYGAAWLKPYQSDLELALLTEIYLNLRFGNTVADQLLGPPALWRVGQFRDGLPQAGEGIWTRCQLLSGAPNDSDRMSMQLNLPFDFEIQNDPNSPVPGAVDVYVQVQVQAFGMLECRTTGGVCKTPGEIANDQTSRRVDRIEAGMGQLMSMMKQLMGQNGR